MAQIRSATKAQLQLSSELLWFVSVWIRSNKRKQKTIREKKKHKQNRHTKKEDKTIKNYGKQHKKIEKREHWMSYKVHQNIFDDQKRAIICSIMCVLAYAFAFMFTQANRHWKMMLIVCLCVCVFVLILFD